jgi:hypothetical protein
MRPSKQAHDGPIVFCNRCFRSITLEMLETRKQLREAVSERVEAGTNLCRNQARMTQSEERGKAPWTPTRWDSTAKAPCRELHCSPPSSF